MITAALPPLEYRAQWSLPVRPEPLLARIAGALTLSLLVTLPALLVDPRQIGAESVWLKPVKFQVALAVYFGTLAVIAAWLPRPVLAAPRMRVFLAVVACATLAEMLWIGGAAMFAVPSHYNPHPVLNLVYLAMGVAAVVLTSVCLVFGVAFWRDRSGRLAEPVRLALALGLMLTFVLTVVAAGTLSARSGPFIGVPVTGAVVPVMGWSREVGDLRVAHFLATHALHVIPLVGLAAVALRPLWLARAVVWAGAAGYAGLTALAFAMALAGRPFA